jgi:hypothetical protein
VTFGSHGAYGSSWRGVLLKICWGLSDSGLVALVYSAVVAPDSDVPGLVESANVLRWCSFRNNATVGALDLMLWSRRGFRRDLTCWCYTLVSTGCCSRARQITAIGSCYIGDAILQPGQLRNVHSPKYTIHCGSCNLFSPRS